MLGLPISCNDLNYKNNKLQNHPTSFNKILAVRSQLQMLKEAKILFYLYSNFGHTHFFCDEISLLVLEDQATEKGQNIFYFLF